MSWPWNSIPRQDGKVRAASFSPPKFELILVSLIPFLFPLTKKKATASHSDRRWPWLLSSFGGDGGRLTAVNLPPPAHTHPFPPLSRFRRKNVHVRAHTTIAHFGLLPGGGKGKGGEGREGQRTQTKAPKIAPAPCGGMHGGVYLPIFWAAEKGA